MAPHGRCLTGGEGLGTEWGIFENQARLAAQLWRAALEGNAWPGCTCQPGQKDVHLSSPALRNSQEGFCQAGMHGQGSGGCPGEVFPLWSASGFPCKHPLLSWLDPTRSCVHGFGYNFQCQGASKLFPGHLQVKLPRLVSDTSWRHSFTSLTFPTFFFPDRHNSSSNHVLVLGADFSGFFVLKTRYSPQL